MSYQGFLMLEGETRLPKRRHWGTLKIEDDKIVFLFHRGNITEIKFEEINSVTISEKFPKTAKRPLINLKDGRKFRFQTDESGGLMNIRRRNMAVFNMLNYSLKK